MEELLPYTFEWRISTNGVNWGNVVGTNQSYDLALPFGQEQIHARVDVVSSDGQTAWDSHEVQIIPIHLKQSFNNINFEFLISPNPTKQETINVFYSTNANITNVKINLIDSFGRVLYNKDKNVEQGEHSDNISIKEFPEGIFYIQLTKDGKPTTQSFLKLK